MSRFACPSCNGQFQVAAENLGQIVRCPHCGATLGTGTLAGQADAGLPASSPAEPAVDVPAAQPANLAGGNWPGAATERLPNPAGVWSLVLGLLFYLGQCGMVGVLMRQVDFRRPGFEERFARVVAEAPLWVTVLGWVLLLMVIASFVLGIYGVSRANRKKGAAWGGLILSGLALLLVAFSFVSGQGN